MLIHPFLPFTRVGHILTKERSFFRNLTPIFFESCFLLPLIVVTVNHELFDRGLSQFTSELSGWVQRLLKAGKGLGKGGEPSKRVTGPIKDIPLVFLM